jgi:hypothetical protein
LNKKPGGLWAGSFDHSLAVLFPVNGALFQFDRRRCQEITGKNKIIRALTLLMQKKVRARDKKHDIEQKRTLLE